jgi:hypothetical protein
MSWLRSPSIVIEGIAISHALFMGFLDGKFFVHLEKRKEWKRIE